MASLVRITTLDQQVHHLDARTVSIISGAGRQFRDLADIQAYVAAHKPYERVAGEMIIPRASVVGKLGVGGGLTYARGLPA